jgi:hypothetical protein
LIALYSLAEIFVFPSWIEALALCRKHSWRARHRVRPAPSRSGR